MVIVYDMKTVAPRADGDEFPYVEVPEELWPMIGKPDEGTRIYRKDGSEEECAPWFDLVCEIARDTVSPGGVSMYCPVSRAAVYKRMKEGRLSAFLFHVTEASTNFFGKGVLKRVTPYVYVPVSECRAWRKELQKRAIERGRVTEEELEGAEPDWYGEFLRWRNKKERKPDTTLYEFIKFMLFAERGD